MDIRGNDAFPTLQILRLLVALSIFSGHWSEPYVIQLWPQGQLAIDLFFVIEGFLSERMLRQSRPARGRLEPMIDRFLHVYPLYLVGLIAGFISVAALSVSQLQGWSVSVWIESFLSGAFFFPLFSSLVHGSVYPLNPPSWAIIQELIGFAALCSISYRPRPVSIAAVCLIAWVALMILGWLWRDPNMGWTAIHYTGGTPRMFFSFFEGALIYHALTRYEGHLPRVNPIWPIAGFVVVQLLRIRFAAWPLLFAGVPFLAVLGAQSSKTAWACWLGRYAGRYALGVYLLAFPIMIGWRLMWPRLPLKAAWAGSPVDFLLVLSTIFLAAAGFTRLTELGKTNKSQDRHAGRLAD